MTWYAILLIELDRGLTKDDFAEHLEDSICPWADKQFGGGWKIWMDGAGSHGRSEDTPAGELVRDALKPSGATLWQPPSHSPDLNPAENLISVLRGHCYKFLRLLTNDRDDKTRTVLDLSDCMQSAYRFVNKDRDEREKVRNCLKSMWGGDGGSRFHKMAAKKGLRIGY
eukprot:gene46175-43277_t